MQNGLTLVSWLVCWVLQLYTKLDSFALKMAPGMFKYENRSLGQYAYIRLATMLPFNIVQVNVPFDRYSWYQIGRKIITVLSRTRCRLNDPNWKKL